ncbi:hypothetical protein MNBD_GAMMA08-2172 [hydrothermal vent metagenome]|uniref:Uncharacterized protein n=1 Tax=hydrothermal vent metagenome TaxID=652676 RepID=A0A3B0Y9R6_9ZZZZ
MGLYKLEDMAAVNGSKTPTWKMSMERP